MSLDLFYRKVADFEAALTPDAKSRLNCKNGCSRCCYTDISIFEVEAQNIRRWFNSLSPELKQQLREKWSMESGTGLDFQNRLVKPCVFLKDDSCSVYEVRPLICRTQGLAMKVATETATFADICPLNEDALTLMKSSDILNLELLNTILSQMERVNADSADRLRVSLRELQNQLKDS